MNDIPGELYFEQRRSAEKQMSSILYLHGFAVLVLIIGLGGLLIGVRGDALKIGLLLILGGIAILVLMAFMRIARTPDAVFARVYANALYLYSPSIISRHVMVPNSTIWMIRKIDVDPQTVMGNRDKLGPFRDAASLAVRLDSTKPSFADIVHYCIYSTVPRLPKWMSAFMGERFAHTYVIAIESQNEVKFLDALDEAGLGPVIRHDPARSWSELWKE